MAVEAAEVRGTINHVTEYMAVVEAGKEVIWMKDFIGELGIRQEEFRLHCDSQSAIHLLSSKITHISTEYTENVSNVRLGTYHRVH